MNAQTRKKISFTLLLLTASAIGTQVANAKTDIAPASVYTVQTRLSWAQHRIARLENRRDYLHRYIKHMRDTWQPPAPPTPSTTSPSAPAPAAPATSTYSSSNGWADELAAAGFPSDAIPTMLGYIDRESGGDPSAINSSSGACGLLQLYPCYGGSAWLDPMTNLRLAYQKYQASGFAPWGG